jgi:DNA segregation ATPase FtsK/SpoIIIE, S-DNA-T family
LREVALLVLGAAAAYLLIALVSFNPADPGWSHTGSGLRVSNLGGRVGAWFADVFFYLFGYLAYLAPLIVGYSGWLLYRGRRDTGELDLHTLGIRWAGFLLTLAAGCGLATMHFGPGLLPLNAGGILGQVLSGVLLSGFGMVGTTLLLLALFLAGVTLFTGLSWFAVMDALGYYTLLLMAWVRERVELALERRAGRKAREERETVVRTETQKVRSRPKPRIEPVVSNPVPSERVQRERQIPLFEGARSDALPPLALLDPAKPHEGGYSEASLEAMSRQVELKLKDFGVEVEVVAVHPGPVITRFELQRPRG